jgi:acetylornithine/succinyldiaminopimelate/putrescine aminotransferase
MILWKNPLQAELAKEIVKNSFKGKVFFANSGAEAVEGVLKLAKAYGRNKGRFEQDVAVLHNTGGFQPS